jgi:hypothetical protein
MIFSLSLFFDTTRGVHGIRLASPGPGICLSKTTDEAEVCEALTERSSNYKWEYVNDEN